MIKQSTEFIHGYHLLVIKKLSKLLEEQNFIGAQEMLMPTIQSSKFGRSGRYDDYGEEMLRIKDRQGENACGNKWGLITDTLDQVLNL